MDIENETIWITGASSGIGQYLALALARHGNKVLVSARSQQVLREMAESHTNIIAVPFDVCEAEAIETVRAELEKHCTTLDRVILNAGICEYFDIDKPDWEMTRRVMDVNFQGVVNSFAVAYPLMKKGSHLVGVASLATAAPFSRAQAYGASKAAFQYWLSTMAVDLKGQGIDVTIVNPGFVKTPLTDKNDFAMPFIMEVEEAVELICKELSGRPNELSFPKRLNYSLRLLNAIPGFWLRFIAPKLARQAA